MHRGFNDRFPSRSRTNSKDSGIASSVEQTPSNSPVKKSFPSAPPPGPVQVPEWFVMPSPDSFFHFLDEDHEQIATVQSCTDHQVDSQTRNAGQRHQSSASGRQIRGRGAQEAKSGTEKRSNRKKRNTETRTTCEFCQNNGSAEWEKHRCYDDRGRVVCPVLSSMKCPHCGATGAKAHTRRHCPVAEVQRRRALESYLMSSKP